MPVIIQGDSREFARLVGECRAVVCSPPFGEPQTGGGICTSGMITNVAGDSHSLSNDGYQHSQQGCTPGQIGAMKAGELDAVVTSPPYADSVRGEHGETETAADTTAKRNTQGGSLGKSQRHGGYGSKGNIGNLKEGTIDGCVTSPPWMNTTGSESGRVANTRIAEAAKRTGKPMHDVVPFEAARECGSYGQGHGNVGNTTGDTYWQAVAEVYQQVYQALKPGGVFVLVVKAYVKAGKRVPLPDQTAELLERLGFRPLERIRAWLVEETIHAGLFGDVREKKERKSFFRRLAESKGSPPIDWEEVICVRKPATTAR
jgi:hypothetical protein